MHRLPSLSGAYGVDRNDGLASLRSRRPVFRHSDTKAELGDGGILARSLGVAILAGGLSVRYFHHLAE